MSNFLNEKTGGDYLPSLQWKSQAVAWEIKVGDDAKSISFDQAIFDIENLKLGWIKIAKGVFDAKLVHYTQQPEPQPTETHFDAKSNKDVLSYKRGFEVTVLMGKEFGSERLFSFSTSAKGAAIAIGDLLEEYEKEAPANPGAVPIVKFEGHTNMAMGAGSTNVPNLKIVGWTARPAELTDSPPTQAEQPASNVAEAAPAQSAAGSNF